MKKTFLAVGLFALFLLFSGCIHGSLDISIPDGITTRMSGDQNYTYYFHNDETYDDTISGTFTATDGDGNSIIYTATYACLTYTIEDSDSVKKNYRDYSFEIKGTNSSDGDITLTIEMTLSAKEYGYDEFREKNFVFKEICEGTADKTTYTVDPDCVFKRETD